MDVNWNLFFPDIKYLTDYNYDIVENEWTQKKYTRVEKILELALLFSKLLNSRFLDWVYLYLCNHKFMEVM